MGVRAEGGTLVIQCVLFDMGGVVVEPVPEIVQEFLSTRQVAPELCRLDLMADPLWEIYKCGGMDEECYWRARHSQLGTPAFSWEDLRDTVEGAVVANPAVVELASRLGDHMRVAMLSNAGAELERRLERLGLRDLFHPVLNSYRVRMAKPNPLVFRYASEVLDLAPGQILFVDDKPVNINAAAQLGFHTHLFVSTEEFAASVINLLPPGNRSIARGD